VLYKGTSDEFLYNYRNTKIDLPQGVNWGERIDYPELTSQMLLDSFMNKYLEKDCPYSTNKVPDEGICVRIEKPFQVYKLKSHRFTMKENEQETVNES